MTIIDSEPNPEPEPDPPGGYARIGTPCLRDDGTLRLRYLPFPPSPKQWVFLGTTCLELFYGGAGGGGKLLNIDTPIATPRGFTPIGDLHPGDYVLGADGQIHTVIGESELVTAPAWRLTFDTGEEIEAHDDHLWNTLTRSERQSAERCTEAYREARRAKRPSRAKRTKSAKFTASLTERNRTSNRPPTLDQPAGLTRTTADIATSLLTAKGEANHAIPVAAALDLPDADLPIDPYVLGVWLGDGHKNTGVVTSADPEILAEMAAVGYPSHVVPSSVDDGLSVAYRVDGLTAALRNLSVLNDKHVPEPYLGASEPQRLALLQGLMDTDGNVSGNSVEFSNTNPAIADAVAHLARSLGMKVTVRPGRAVLNGRDCGPNWRMKFAANRILFRLQRKANTQKIATRSTTRYHYITKAERTAPVTMKCIQVSNPDGLYLAGHHLIPTHNSYALLAAALQFVDVPGYAALILRRKLTDLTMPGALIAMSEDWLGDIPGATFNKNERKWTFPSGAVVQFGYCNHIQDVGRYRGPLRPETEVLTDNGWVRIDAVEVGDRVASFDPETRAAGMQPVSAVHEWDYDDDLVTVHQRTGVSFAATPEHTLWYRTAKRPELRRGRVGEVTSDHNQVWVPRNGTWTDGDAPEPREFVPTNTKGPKVPTLRFSPEDWAEFLGWYVTEGHLGINKEKNLVGITQKILANQPRIEALLDRIGAKWYRYDDRHYKFSNGALADYLRANCGRLAAGKCLPREVFDYTPQLRRVLLDTLVDGDGSHYPDEYGKMLFVTTSRQLWDDVSELATRCGLTATSGTTPRTKFYGRTKQVVPVDGEVTYRLSITDRRGRDREIRRDDVHREHYKGKVHCLTVDPWHTIIIRYRGRVSVTGNTEYHFIGWDELGEFPSEYPYTFLYSRLRRPAGLSRADIIESKGVSADGLTILDLPLRVRSASNPGGPGCVPYGDVLTPTGWVPIQQVGEGDPVFSVAPDGSLVTAKVEHAHRYQWEGDLAVVNARGFHAAVTPNHRMAKTGGIRSGKRGRSDGSAPPFSLVRFDELPGQATILRSVNWQGVSLGDVRPEPVEQRKLKHHGPESLPAESYCRLLGWFLSEGSSVDRDKAFDISQIKPHGRVEIARLLEEECGFNVCWNARSARVHSARWWQHFRQFGRYAPEKFIPDWVKNATVPELRALLDGLMAGDGTWSGPLGSAGCGTYYTSSPQLASDVVEIALKCGYIVSHRTRDKRGPMTIEGREVTCRHVSHEVNIKPATKSGGTEILTGQHRYNVTTTTKRRSDVESVPYSGEVYCITVPGAETFIIRQDGSVWVSGNSAWVKRRFVDPETRVAPFIPATFRDNPAINAEEYKAALAMLPEIERRRMELGDWTIQEVKGALWELKDISVHRSPWTRLDGTEMFDRVYVGVDPSVGGGHLTGDECGIVAGGILGDGRVIVLVDGSLRAHPDVWAQAAVTLHEDLGGTGIVIENNHGHELLRTQIRDAADQLGLPQPPVLLANAKGSKEFRAGTVAPAYRNPKGMPKVVHSSDESLKDGELEGQMVAWVPGASKAESGVKSPDRVDGLVWCLRGLLWPSEIDDFSQTTDPVEDIVDKLRTWNR